MPAERTRPLSRAWRYEASTKTIRAVPSNHWIASMNSFDAAEDHDANAALIARAPELLRLAAIIGARPIGSTARDTCEAQVALHRICLELGAL